MQLDLTLFSKYRTELMGISALLIILCHMPASVPEMPGRLGYLLSIGNIGVDFFLFLSGLGIFYSLQKHDDPIHNWYRRRFTRILIPYLLLSVPFYLIKDWDAGVMRMCLDISTLSFWIDHKSAWFIALLLPLYLVSPFIYDKCGPLIWRGLLTCLGISILSLVLSSSSSRTHDVLDNVSFALMRVPSFIMGMATAPLIRSGLKINLGISKVLLLIILPFLFIGIGKYFIHNLYLMWVSVPLLLFVACLVIQGLPNWLKTGFKWGGVISLESYLLNIYTASLFKHVDFGFSNYLKYLLLFIADIFLAILIWKVGQIIIGGGKVKRV